MKPVVFQENRVWRAYLGGCGITFLKTKKESPDNHFPEDWIASCVEACNHQYKKPGQGLSVLENGTLFADYLNSDPEKNLGQEHVRKYGNNPGFLMKILDSAERLPIQVHPTVEDAEKYYHSKQGKTECWYVISTRKVNGVTPCLYLGTNETMEKETFLEEAANGVFQKGESMLRKWEVKPGDVFMVPGGVPHAIGAGVTMIEVMEPSDWVVQPEHFCGEQPLTDADRFGPLSPEKALEIFRLEPENLSTALQRYCPEPVIIDRMDQFTLSAIVPLKLIKLFEVQKLTGAGDYELQNREAVCRAGVVTEGNFELGSGEETIKLSTGQSFFLPASGKRFRFRGAGTILFALPEYHS